MKLDYNKVGQVKIIILKYIDEIIDAFDREYPMDDSNKSSAAPAILLKVKKYCKQLNIKKYVEFYNLAARILSAIKKSRPETCTAV